MARSEYRSALRTVLWVATLLTSSAVAAQESGEKYLAEYQASRAAMDSGQRMLAIRHAHNAWLAAEDALGDDQLTAILAYNYAALALIDNNAESLAALERALALQESAVADLPDAELRVYHAYAVFTANDRERRFAKRLRDALLHHETAGAVDDRYVAAAWLHLAADDVAHDNYRKAAHSAMRAEEAMTSVDADDYRTIANAILLRGIADVMPTDRRIADAADAHDHFQRALALFPPQPGIDDFDTTLAKIFAWDAATDAALLTLGRKNYPGEGANDNARPFGSGPMFKVGGQSATNCENLEWSVRKAPRFPMQALRRGSIGAVLLGFNIGSDLTVKDARVLAEVPGSTFGDAALEAVKDWRIEKLPQGPAECLLNYTTLFKFSIEG